METFDTATATTTTSTATTTTTRSTAKMLSFENQMLLDSISSDSLTVAAKGLGVERVFQSLLRVYSDPGNLVIVLGTRDNEEEYFMKNLGEVKIPPKKITAEISVSERQKVYLAGGVLFMTTRILVVDMLTDRLPVHLVTGILIFRAHKTAESCQETFALRLFRQKNNKGFIKAFTMNPSSLGSDVDRAMRSMFLSEVHLWPRFHADVVQCFRESAIPEVVELRLDMNKDMRSVQTSVLDLINFSLQELKRLNPSLRALNDELTVENAAAKNYLHKLLQRELEPIWHELSWKTKTLVQDLKTLRSILTHLTQYDCLTFLSFVSALRTTENALKSGGWMILDEADNLFVTAKARVFKGPKGDEFTFEENPKWKCVIDVVQEIKDECSKDTNSSFPSDKVLVLCSDERTSRQIQDVLHIGSKHLLARMFNRMYGEKHGMLVGYDKENDPKTDHHPFKHLGLGKKSSGNGNGIAIVESPVIMVQSTGEPFELFKLIHEVKPKYVVMYDIEVSVVRQLEVFQALNPDLKVKVYFMMYSKSVEEQAYLTSLRKEKEAFERLMEQKKVMVIPEDREGKAGTNPDLVRDNLKASDTIMALKAKSSKDAASGGGEERKVIVDMREFRCELPGLIHKRGIDIEPLTIEVGDYVLTPEICVERKSVSDLIGSLQNGRLYNQSKAMTRCYQRPMLLIEFDVSKKPFHLSKDMASFDILAKLQLLTLHFPKMRILWSPSPQATAELFDELKKGRPEPIAELALKVSPDEENEAVTAAEASKYNSAIHDFVIKLPGVTSKNVFSLLNKVENLPQLLTLEREELGEILDSSVQGDLLYDSLHIKAELLTKDQTEENSKGKKRTKDNNKGENRFKSKRRKV